MPIQNVGRLKPNMEPAITKREPIAVGFNPARMPSGTPITIPMTIAAVANSSVAGMRWKINSMAGLPNT